MIIKLFKAILIASSLCLSLLVGAEPDKNWGSIPDSNQVRNQDIREEKNKLGNLIALNQYPEIIKISVPTLLGGLNKKDGTGSSDIILKYFQQRVTEPYYEVHKQPLKRAIGMTVSKKFDCFLGTSPGAFKLYTKRDPIDSIPYAEIEWRFLTRLDQPIVSTFEDLSDKKLVGVLGAILSLNTMLQGKDIPVSIEEAYTEELAIKMLKRGRVSVAFIGFDPKVQLPGYHYDSNFLHLKGGRMLSCDKDHRLANRLIEDFNRVVKERNQ